MTHRQQATRRARIETDHGDSERAAAIANAVSPDNTAQMETRTEGSRIVTTIDRETTGGMQSTADDYVVNLQVAAQLATTDGETSTTTDNI
ncbi:KEOPS complex subunit Pcc1 [Halovenus amylolytica]|uniref:KEOPS complex subunit Pcc1 n=1 Tax=Halovenus amylolytica TaxID=2500550 RepID=UPI0036089C0E